MAAGDIAVELTQRFVVPEERATEILGRPRRHINDDQWDMDAADAVAEWVEEHLAEALRDFSDGEPQVDPEYG